MILSSINALILFAIAFIHVYWALGGKWAVDKVFPKIKNAPEFRPGVFMTLLVAFIFLAMGLFFAQKAAWVQLPWPSFALDYGLQVLAVVFVLRSVGDFRYIGFTKTIKNSPFAHLDTIFYSPLSLYIGLTSLIIKYI